MNLFQIGKVALTKYPRIIKLSSMLYNHILGRNRIKIKGKNNHFICYKSFLKGCKIEVLGNDNKIIIGEKCLFLNTSISIKGDNNSISIGDLTVIHNGEFHMEDNRNIISIGKKTLIAGRTHLAAIEGTSIDIGCYCLFSSSVTFRTGDSHSILNTDGKRINNSQNIKINDHVWIGYGATICKGVTLENDSIVGTGSIVTKSIEEKNVIIAGIPAKIIKTDINWDINRI